MNVKKNKEKSLFSIIYKEFFLSSLVPFATASLLAIIIFLILMKYMSMKQKQIHIDENIKHLQTVTTQFTNRIDEKLKEIVFLTSLLNKKHQEIFDNPEKCNRIDEKLNISNTGVLYKLDNDGETSLYYSANSKNNIEKTKKIKLTAALSSFYKNMVKQNKLIQGVYFGSTDGMLREYPFVDNVSKKYGPNLNLHSLSEFSTTTKDSSFQHNWSNIYKDKGSGEWMLTCFSPVYSNNILQGVVGINITLESFNTIFSTKWELWGAQPFLINNNNRLIFASKDIINTFNLTTDYSKNNNLFSLTSQYYNETYRKPILKLLNSNEGYTNISIKKESYILYKTKVEEANWHIFILVPQKNILSTFNNYLTIIKNVLILAIILTVIMSSISFSYIFSRSTKLSNKISSSIVELTNAVKIASSKRVNLKKSNITEINKLSGYFNSILTELNIQQKELKNLNKNLTLEISKEVEKNREQERIVFQQARLVQISELIGNIAHQWRQPLNEIALITQTLQFAEMDKSITNKMIATQTNQIMEIIDRMSSTIDHFRKFFKSSNEKEVFNIEKQINEAINIVKHSYEEKNITFITNYEGNAEIYNFKQDFIQILLNIFSNAEHIFLERKLKNRYLKISLSIRDSRFIEIKIQDSAGGIEGDIILKIFDPYFSTKKETNETGLGLYMSKMILTENMGGNVTVSNEMLTVDNNMHAGACFKITIPITVKSHILKK